MKPIQLSSQEKKIEKALLNKEFIKVDPHLFKKIAQAVSNRKKDAVLNIRVNHQDIQNIKYKAKLLGVKYQTLISEVLHQVALR